MNQGPLGDLQPPTPEVRFGKSVNGFSKYLSGVGWKTQREKKPGGVKQGRKRGFAPEPVAGVYFLKDRGPRGQRRKFWAGQVEKNWVWRGDRKKAQKQQCGSLKLG